MITSSDVTPDGHGVPPGLQGPGADLLAPAESAKWPPADWPEAIKQLHCVKVTASAGLEVHVREHEAEPTAAAHQQPPGALRVVVIGLGVVGGADAATRRGQVPSTTW